MVTLCQLKCDCHLCISQPNMKVVLLKALDMVQDIYNHSFVKINFEEALGREDVI